MKSSKLKIIIIKEISRTGNNVYKKLGIANNHTKK
jgi:hypothetical protein